MKTSDIWRSQSFIFIDEASDWLARDFYANDVQGVIADLESIIDWAQSKIDDYRDYLLDNPAPSVIG